MGKEHKRVIVIGSSGAGKSTLSNQLAQKWALPLIHLDSVYWNPGWVPTPSDEFRVKVEEKLKEERWIIDGNFNSTLKLRAQHADLIIFLDFPKVLCTYRIIKRYWTYKGVTRPDMGRECPEKIDKEFVKWVWNFPKGVRPGILNALREVASTTDICILRNPKEVKHFIKTAPSF